MILRHQKLIFIILVSRRFLRGQRDKDIKNVTVPFKTGFMVTLRLKVYVYLVYMTCNVNS